MVRHGEHARRQKANMGRKINAIDENWDIGAIGSDTETEDQPDYEAALDELTNQINALKKTFLAGNKGKKR